MKHYEIRGRDGFVVATYCRNGEELYTVYFRADEEQNEIG